MVRNFIKFFGRRWVMRRGVWFSLVLVLVLCGIFQGFSTIPSVYAMPAHIKVTVSSHEITAGVNNNITIRLTSIDLSIRELRAVLDLSLTPLVLLGDNHWKFTYLDEGESVEINIVLYAPESAIGSTCTARLELTFGTPGLQPSEVHTINFVIYGWIDMVIYDMEVDPNPVTAGSQFTISANILNRGNVSIVPTDILTLIEESVTYVGQVDPNAPVPFFLSAVVNSDVDEGEYPIVIQVVYQDDKKVFHTITRTVQIRVVRPVEKPPPPPSQRFQLWLTQTGWVYVSLVCVVAAALVLYLRRRGRQGRLEIEQLSPPESSRR